MTMQKFPHVYSATSESDPQEPLRLTADGLPTLTITPPAEFDGPGDQWSPETLLTASVSTCLILTFRAIASASGLKWQTIRCTTEATLDRIERVSRFTKFDQYVELVVPEDVDKDKAERLVEKAEAVCLVTNSLTGERSLSVTIRTNEETD
jgi:peroxiredoxin-like protein